MGLRCRFQSQSTKTLLIFTIESGCVLMYSFLYYPHNSPVTVMFSFGITRCCHKTSLRRALVVAVFKTDPKAACINYSVFKQE